MDVSMARLLLGFSILAFPLILPFVFSAFFITQDDGISNEDRWATEGKECSGMVEAPNKPNLSLKSVITAYIF